jgi:hypothetical protein
MNMFVRNVSFYQQMQDWRVGQSKMNAQILGPSGTGTDFSSAFADAANNYYSGLAVLGATAMGTRISNENQLAAAKTSGNTTADTGLAAAQTAGNLILSQLGIAGANVGVSSSSQSGQTTTSQYAAPINAATGYSYVQSSAAELSSLDTINIFA